MFEIMKENFTTDNEPYFSASMYNTSNTYSFMIN